MFVEGGACAMAQWHNGQSKSASKFTPHRAVVPVIAWLLFLSPCEWCHVFYFPLLYNLRSSATFSIPAILPF